MTFPRDSYRFRHRLPAAVALIPLCAMAWLLIFHVPVGNRSVWRLANEVTIEGNAVVRTERLAWIKRRVAISLETGKSSISAYGREAEYTRTYQRVNSRGDSIRIGTDAPFTVVYVEDRSGHVMVDTRIKALATLVGDDYLVSASDGQFAIRDLRSIGNVVISPTSLQDISNVRIEAVDGFDRFVRHAQAPSGEVLELYEIVDCQARLLSRWPVENGRFGCFDGKIYSWKSTDAPGRW